MLNTHTLTSNDTHKEFNTAAEKIAAFLRDNISTYMLMRNVTPWANVFCSKHIAQPQPTT